MILKLASHGAFDAPMAGIVDARRHFICEQAAFAFEKLDGKDADVIECFEYTPSRIFRVPLHILREAGRWSYRETKNSVAMMILDQRIKGDLSLASTNREYGKFAGKIDKLF